MSTTENVKFAPTWLFVKLIFLIILIVIIFTSITLTKMRYMPEYKVWEQKLAGEAELDRAEQNRRNVIQEAETKRDAAKFLAEAEVERAKGVAQANKIIGEGLKGQDEYLRYLWITSMEHVASSVNGSTVVYVPTEGGIPVSESRKSSPGRGSIPGSIPGSTPFGDSR